MDGIETVNWLAHRWPIELVTRPYGQKEIYAQKKLGQRVGQRSSREEYDPWIKRARPTCLARFIASRPFSTPQRS